MQAPKKRRWRRRIAWAAGLGVAAWLLLSYAAAYYLTRRPRAVHPEPPPAIAWGTAEAVRLATRDGHQIGGWFIPGRPDRPTVLLMHGNGGNRSDCLKAGEMVASVGCSALLLSARAHGDSSGEVNDFGYSARHDVAAGVEWLHRRSPGKPVVVWGKSLGSAAALFAAADLGERVSGYILECPYRDLYTALRNRTRLYLPAGVEAVVYTGMATVTPLVLTHANAISPLEAAGAVPGTARVLILAGGADTRARPEEAEAIAERLGGRAELVTFEGADHMGLERADPVRYREAVLGLLGR
jgi:alpha-beta hydrolase superfamily lysophospholipase